ncbi:TPA: hypothetical protein ACH3X3_009865 [Trebouxia sp. C0006]
MSWTAWSSLHRPACACSHQPSLSKRSLFAAGHVKEVTHRNIQHHNQLCANSTRRTKVQAGSTAQAKSRSGKASSRKKAEKWRLFEVKLPIEDDPGKDTHETSVALCSAVALKLKCKGLPLPLEAVSVIRKSFDARAKHRGFAYVVDIDPEAARAAGASPRFKSGQLERLPHEAAPASPQIPRQAPAMGRHKQDPIVIVGSGPAGLFAALELAQANLPVVILERGQPVESRGRDIGALIVRRMLNPDSNLCYGEGGAGTWSDGKLTTKVGRNSDPVRRVLHTLYTFGAPQNILVAGKPHLGTDRLIKILQAFRKHLTVLGVQIHFGSCVTDLVIEHNKAVGVKLRGGEIIPASKVVLAVGHSSRAMYETLAARGIALSPKPFALGLRVEHPQALIDNIQYGQEYAAEVQRGKGRVPVADYSLTAQALPDYADVSSHTAMHAAATHSPASSSSRPQSEEEEQAVPDYAEVSPQTAMHAAATQSPSSSSSRSHAEEEEGSGQGNLHDRGEDGGHSQNARLPSSSSSDLASSQQWHDSSCSFSSEHAQHQGRRQSGAAASTTTANGSKQSSHNGTTKMNAREGRGVYSFCMCPGGQIVPTTTNPEELCINGMSFSRRNSLWANSALVVAVQPPDWAHLEPQHGALAGVALQIQAERLAAKLGGGNLVAPVQRVTDFLAGQLSSGALPSSSYRLGVKSASLHEVYSPAISQALKSALQQFEQKLPGFVSDAGLLHGVETRTSSPVRIDRGDDLQSLSTAGLYPCGEGAGYAGGIVSAAVDGMKIAHAIVQNLAMNT